MKHREAIPRGARVFEARMRVQWADVDIAGIMYFGAYQRFVERAEMEFFRELGFPYHEVFDKYGMWLPRVHMEATYHHPALMDDWLTLRTYIEHVGASSVRWKSLVDNERTDEIGAVYSLTAACIDRNERKARPLPPELRLALTACIGEAA